MSDQYCPVMKIAWATDGQIFLLGIVVRWLGAIQGFKIADFG